MNLPWLCTSSLTPGEPLELHFCNGHVASSQHWPGTWLVCLLVTQIDTTRQEWLSCPSCSLHMTMHGGTQPGLPRGGQFLFQGRKCCQGRLHETARKSSSELILILGLDMFYLFSCSHRRACIRGLCGSQPSTPVSVVQLTSAWQVLYHYVRLWVDNQGVVSGW